jgi:hypothetical protein
VKAILVDGPLEGYVVLYEYSVRELYFAHVDGPGVQLLAPSARKIAYYQMPRICSEPDTFHFSIEPQ